MLLQFGPARPLQLRRVVDLPQQAAPFDDRAVDVPRAQQLRHPVSLVGWVRVQRSDNLFRPRAVTRRHSGIKIAGNGGVPVTLAAGDRDAPLPAILLVPKTVTGIEVRQLIDQLVDRQ